jgi:hypothetical protein
MRGEVIRLQTYSGESSEDQETDLIVYEARDESHDTEH